MLFGCDKILPVNINLYTQSTWFPHFEMGARHFKLALVSSTQRAIDRLKGEGVILRGSQGEIPIGYRLKNFCIGLLEIIPVIGRVILFIERYFCSSVAISTDPVVDRVIKDTPQFGSYKIAGKGITAREISLRPPTLFFDAAFGKAATIRPGVEAFFRFEDIENVRRTIEENSERVIEVTAKGKQAQIGQSTINLEDYLGCELYRISLGEIKEMLASQRVYVSALLPKHFYLDLRAALDADQVKSLPREVLMSELLNSTNFPNVGALLKKVSNDPAQYGFGQGKHLPFQTVMCLKLDQVASMVVKSDDYRSFVGEGYSIEKREVGTKDAFKVISLSGIRDFHKAGQIQGNEDHQIDHQILKESWKSAIQATGESGYLVTPAVGLGVWGGDPNIYWRAFLDALVETEVNFAKILINPGHQSVRLDGREVSGQEFGEMLAQYISQNPKNKNLKKVDNLFYQKTDLFLLAKNLQKAKPKTTVALINASDPDCTLGDCVGEYVNNLRGGSTTEENYAALGTFFAFEQLTGVREGAAHRVIQMA